MKEETNGAIRYDQGKTEYHNWHPKALARFCRKLAKDRFTDTPYLIDIMIDWFYIRIPITRVDTSAISPVLAYGASKYAHLNYTKGMLYSRVFNSFMRHAIADLENPGSLDDVDELGNKGSGLPHIQHAHCNIFFAFTYSTLDYDGGAWDDRPGGRE